MWTQHTHIKLRDNATHVPATDSYKFVALQIIYSAIQMSYTERADNDDWNLHIPTRISFKFEFILNYLNKSKSHLQRPVIAYSHLLEYNYLPYNIEDIEGPTHAR